MVETITCPICANVHLENSNFCKDYTVSHENFSLVKCTVCGLKITSPRPTDSELSKYYLSEDYISHSNKARSIIDKAYLFIRKFTLKRKVKLISQFASIPTILDYGCGTGEFLNICKSAGWVTTGIEPSTKARQMANQLSNLRVYSSSTDLPDVKYEIITLWHVLEHISDLDAVVKDLSKRLSDHGTIFIAVPNYECYDAAIYKDYWAGYDVPRHLWHFSKHSIEKLLHSHSLKLKSILPMSFDSFYVSLLSERYKNNNAYSIAGCINAFMIGLRSNIKAKKTGKYSSLIYIVQK